MIITEYKVYCLNTEINAQYNVSSFEGRQKPLLQLLQSGLKKKIAWSQA